MSKAEYKQLEKEDWGKIYNCDFAKSIINDLNAGNLTCQTIEMLKITKAGDKVLEIGCGSGATSAYLALKNRVVTALDYSEESLACTKAICDSLECKMDIVMADATKDLPFHENCFDYVFQAGLLEHFEKEKRIELLKIWGKSAKKMISIIPNAASIAYRTGKKLMEDNGTWCYGMELPQYTMIDEFSDAGFIVDSEYTIGLNSALDFLPKKHYLRKALNKWIKEDMDEYCGQGYLLVTLGHKKDL